MNGLPFAWPSPDPIVQDIATMEVAAAEETIVVTGEAPSALETTSVGANFTAEEIDVLPVARNPQAIAELSGGNDGLNTVLPYADPEYSSLRPRLALPRDQVLQLDARTIWSSGFVP